MGEVTRLSDIDISNTVYMTVTNPYYKNSEIMDVAYEYPKESTRILNAFKLAQRLGLKITYITSNSDAAEWLEELYDTYIKISD